MTDSYVDRRTKVRLPEKKLRYGVAGEREPERVMSTLPSLRWVEWYGTLDCIKKV